MVHTLFIGFAMSMIFAHAAIIVPALLGRQMAWTVWLWAPLALLWFSLAVRICGDLTDHVAVSRCGGLLNAIAILAFAGIAVVCVRRGAGRASA